jgi:TonB family protein
MASILHELYASIKCRRNNLDRSHARTAFEDIAPSAMWQRAGRDQGRRYNPWDRIPQEQVPEFKLLESSLEDRKRWWASLGTGSVLDFAGLALMLWLGVVLPGAVIEDASRQNLWTARVVLYSPAVEKPVPPAPTHPTTKLDVPTPTVKPSKLIEPRPVIPPLLARVRTPVPQPPKLRPAAPRTELARPTLPKWEPKVEVGAFSGASPAVAKLKVPPSKVQTGGFGSPNGLPGQAQGESRGNVAHLGAFDLPSGPGHGNGSAGAQGARGVVASAGFGNGIAAAPGARSQRGGEVESAGFADIQSLNQSAASAQPREAAPSYKPVEVIAKPNPVYTAEARRLRIQGEVLVRVVFTASGKLEILGVARGLGHGLDEAAIQAAERIQFKPARQNGQPVDTNATLHILFQLAG